MLFVIFAVINYEVTVVTGEVFAAGTDAKVFLQIYGEDGKTEVIQLKSRSNNFERGTTEIFKVCEHVCCANLNRPNKVRIFESTVFIYLFFLILPNSRESCFYFYPLKQEYQTQVTSAFLQDH